MSLQRLWDGVLDVLPHALALGTAHRPTAQELLLGHDLHLPVVTEKSELGSTGQGRPQTQEDGGSWYPSLLFGTWRPRGKRVVAGGRGLLRPPAREKTRGTHTEKFHLHWQAQALPGASLLHSGLLPPPTPSSPLLAPQPAGLCKNEQ